MSWDLLDVWRDEDGPRFTEEDFTDLEVRAATHVIPLAGKYVPLLSSARTRGGES